MPQEKYGARSKGCGWVRFVSVRGVLLLPSGISLQRSNVQMRTGLEVEGSEGEDETNIECGRRAT